MSVPRDAEGGAADVPYAEDNMPSVHHFGSHANIGKISLSVKSVRGGAGDRDADRGRPSPKRDLVDFCTRSTGSAYDGAFCAGACWCLCLRAAAGVLTSSRHAAATKMTDHETGRRHFCIQRGAGL
jgi:hypothetical protein